MEEKLDGANLGFSLSPNGKLLVQNRGQYLAQPYLGQFARFSSWLSLHQDALLGVLRPEWMLFGEWCAARHSLDYNTLPDWFLLFDVYDRNAERFWSTARRDALASSAGLEVVPEIFRGHVSMDKLKEWVADTPSRYRDGPLEGIVVRRESDDWCNTRAKLVSPDFTQAIATHWRKRAIQWNRVDVSHQNRTAGRA
ncbi:RNA ligase family protein [Burkholderia gladioli]|uniref:RNA ligase family protein n=1 Tax=Burkholderia gladioli TaxID=28095 RepID=UPI001FC7D88E|nr:RNA ligase family protein [Burkholderia gladioli]